MPTLRAKRAPASARNARVGKKWAALDGVHQMTRAEQAAAGKKLRERCPRTSQATWKKPPNRADAVDLVLAAERGRHAELLPLRHGRGYASSAAETPISATSVASRPQSAG